MLPVVNLLSKVSGFFFTAGFILANIKYIIPLFVIPITQFLSLISNAIAYALNLLGSYFRPEYQAQEKWYGFDSFKNQFSYAALLGFYGAIINIGALYVPILIIPAAWLFFTGNLMTSISEFHKLKTPFFTEENYSSLRQNKQVSHALILAATALVAALSTTLIFIFPMATAFILGGSTLLTLGLGALNVRYWLEINWSHFENTQSLIESYDHITQELGSDVPRTVEEPLPHYQGFSLFITPKNVSSDAQLSGSYQSIYSKP